MLTAEAHVRSTLISGEPEICKALLFEAAVSWAKDGQQVYYFAAKPLDSLPLSFHDRTEPSADVLRLMTFIYTPTYDELASQLLRLHTFRRPASLLLIDELEEFAGPSLGEAARCCALLLHAARACAEASGRPVRLCAVSSCEDAQLLRVQAGYFDGRWNASSAGLQPDSEEARAVWLREPRARLSLELARLDDAVLTLRRIFAEEQLRPTELTDS